MSTEENPVAQGGGADHEAEQRGHPLSGQAKRGRRVDK